MDDWGHGDDGKVDDMDPTIALDGLSHDIESCVHDHAAVVGRLLVPGDTETRSSARAFEKREDLGIEPAADGADVLAPEARGGISRLGDP